MKRKILLFTAFMAVGLTSSAFAADWRDLAADAYAKADIVARGTVQSVDDQTAVDGGHVYGLELTSLQKGSPADQVQFRAGGFLYLVPLNVGDSVMVFLKSTSAAAAIGSGPDYSLVEVEGLRPMAFLVAGAQAKPVDDRLNPDFANVKIADLNDLLSSIKP